MTSVEYEGPSTLLATGGNIVQLDIWYLGKEGHVGRNSSKPLLVGFSIFRQNWKNALENRRQRDKDLK